MVLSLIPEPGASVVASAAADTSALNTTTETALCSFAIPKTAKAGDLLEFVAGGDLLNNSGSSVNYVLKVKIGATSVLLSPSQAVSNSSFRRTWNARVAVVVGATNAQYAFGRIHLSAASSNTWQAASIGIEGYGSATEDLTAGKNLQLTVALGTAASTIDMVLHAAALIHIRS